MVQALALTHRSFLEASGAAVAAALPRGGSAAARETAQYRIAAKAGQAPLVGGSHPDTRIWGYVGDPYTRTGADFDGRVSIEWGVYGVPETFAIDREGRIVFKQVGPVTPEVYRDKIGLLLQERRK